MILVEDEAGVYLQATTTAVWAAGGQTSIVRVDAGREKVNFYGILNLRTGQEVAMRAAVMNAETTGQYLERILDTIRDVGILILWDRATWHRGQPIQRVMEANPRLQLTYFPADSPDLNPQEHVWKATRRAVSHNHRILRMPELADRFEQHLKSTTFESSFLDRYGFNSICAMLR